MKIAPQEHVQQAAKSSKSARTKAKLIQSTIKLVEKNGFQGISLREVSANSNQNLASVSYYFGNKEGLLQAIINGYLVDLTQNWTDLLDNYLATYAEGSRTAEGIISCLINPFILLNNPSISLQLHRAVYVQDLMEVSEFTFKNNDSYNDCLFRYSKYLAKIHPHLSTDHALKSVHMFISAALNSMIQECKGKESLPPLEERHKILDNLSQCLSLTTKNPV